MAIRSLTKDCDINCMRNGAEGLGNPFRINPYNDNMGTEKVIRMHKLFIKSNWDFYKKKLKEICLKEINEGIELKLGCNCKPNKICHVDEYIRLINKMSYTEKDRIKFSICNKLITRGVQGSSSYRYETENPFDLIINPNEFKKSDIVGVSINGRRKGHLSFDRNLVFDATQSRATLIKDNSFNTKRAYNIGERDLESYLVMQGYVKAEEDNVRSIWKHFKSI
jgi:hypothetical protein